MRIDRDPGRAAVASWWRVIERLLVTRSIENETEGAAITAAQLRTPPGDAVDAAEAADQRARWIGRIGESVVRPRQVLLRHGAHDIGGDDHHQLGLAVDEIAAAEQSAEHGKLRQAGHAVDLLLTLLLDHAGHDQRAA